MDECPGFYYDRVTDHADVVIEPSRTRQESCFIDAHSRDLNPRPKAKFNRQNRSRLRPGSS